MKVYCRSCKHRKSWEAAMGCCGYHCKVNKIVGETPIQQNILYMNCEVVNANNDCKDYKCKWLTDFTERYIAKSEERISNRFEILDL